MQITQEIIDYGLLSELAYLKLENYAAYKDANSKIKCNSTSFLTS